MERFCMFIRPLDGEGGHKNSASGGRLHYIGRSPTSHDPQYKRAIRGAEGCSAWHVGGYISPALFDTVIIGYCDKSLIVTLILR